MHDPTDEQLLRAFQRGDATAFATFVDRHQDRVYRLALLWLKDPGLAEDALQETLVRSYTGFGRFRFRARPSTWLLRVCRNVCRELNRRRRFEPLDERMLEGLRFEPDPGRDRDQAARIAELRAALATLPERQAQVVSLRMLEELSVADTAAVMGCREGTVKAHLHRAMTALRHRLQNGGSEAHERGAN